MMAQRRQRVHRAVQHGVNVLEPNSMTLRRCLCGAAHLHQLLRMLQNETLHEPALGAQFGTADGSEPVVDEFALVLPAGALGANQACGKSVF